VHAGKTTYVITVWASDTQDNCFAHSYGDAVRAYLHAHPCGSLTRLLATTTVGGRPVGFAQSAVAFAGPYPQIYTVAGRFRALVTEDGTGSVDDLLREGNRLPSGPAQIPQPDAFSALSEDSVVTIVDAWYLDGPTPENAAPLEKMARDIYLQF